MCFERVADAQETWGNVRFQMLPYANCGNLLDGEHVMPDPSIRTYLAQAAFFRGLSSEHLDQLASYGSAMRYSAQQRLFKSDTDADKFYIVRDGKVAVEIPAVEGEPLRLQSLGNHGVLGWSWLIPPYRWLFDARALVASDIIVMDGVKLRAHCESDQALGYQLFKRFAVLMNERLNASRVAAIKQHTGH
jgi:CRP/FNR family transcriptional regulator, cyclic AMP receptor protein